MCISKFKSVYKSGYILYDFNYMTFWKKQKYGDSKKLSGYLWGGKAL